jgi:hypothetical protein
MGYHRKPASLAGLIILPIAILGLASCSAISPYLAFLQDWNYTFDDGDIQFSSTQSLLEWMSTRIAYSTDSAEWGHEEYWAAPEQTFDAGCGDCDDKAILFMYFAYTRGLMKEVQFVGIVLSDGNGHALVRQDDTYYDPTRGLSFPVSSMNGQLLYRLNYGQTLYIATHDHAQARSEPPLGLAGAHSLTGNVILAGKSTQGESRNCECHPGLTRRDHVLLPRDAPLPGSVDDHR